MRKFIEQWIKNPDRDMAVGVQIFESLGSDLMKKRYLEFSKKWESNSMAASILIEQVRSIVHTMALQPSYFEGKELPFLTKNEGGINPLAMSFDQLPDNVKKAVLWNKENTPLIASIHAELSNENITDVQRKEIADQLIDLVLKREENWEIIDDFFEGKNVEKLELPDKEVETVPLLRGIQIARRIERLKENIKRSQSTAEDKESSKKVKDNAVKRVEQYTQELNAMEEELKTLEDDSGKIQ